MPNLLIPFRRDRKRDFASGDGAELLESQVRMALLTEGEGPKTSGEMPWRTAFGSLLTLLRHQLVSPALRELARVYAQDALKRWVPGAKLVSLELRQQGTAVFLEVSVVRGTERASVRSPLAPAGG